ncbi:MAG TPA: DUF2950 domain-containing protein [Bryobacteraceae bacterium]|nr:DUF2950 domain-containing protein [Bryobacteraceae bacterium]
MRTNSAYWIGAIGLTVAAALLHAQAQQTFATPKEAADALVAAAEHNDTAALMKVLGPASKDIVESGDPAEDKSGRAQFAERAHARMRVDPEPGNPDRAVVIVGQDDWPFPVPLYRKAGRWSFDAARGRTEILARRIGRNEMGAIEVCRGYVEAQMAYAAHDRNGDGMLQYAQKIVSSSGKKDGLYWAGESDALVPKAFADAAAALLAEGKKPAPYHGYFFHILKAQGPDAPGGAMDYVVKGKMMGGFAMVAYPAEYGVSGVKTFLVNHRGMVYEKDLGSATATVARQMTRFNPDKTWKAVEGE